MNSISEDEFLANYRPVPNVLDTNASFDFGDGGCLYETYGAELEHIRRQPPSNIWTVIESDGSLAIASGFHIVNRLGYILTEVPVSDNACVEVLIDQEMEGDEL